MALSAGVFPYVWARRPFQFAESTHMKRILVPIYCSALAGMTGLGCLLIYHPTDYAMPVFLACMALLVVISQMITWGIAARPAGRQGEESVSPVASFDDEIVEGPFYNGRTVLAA
jgi:hypothetical protein